MIVQKKGVVFLIKELSIKKKSFMENSKNGFTLMEIIVVIAIVAILVAVALPSITGYIEKARETSDLVVGSNTIDSIQMALMLTDHGLPPNTYIEVVWVTSTTNDGRVYDGSVLFRNPTERKSVFSEGDYPGDPIPFNGSDEDFRPIATSVLESLKGNAPVGATGIITGGGMYGFVGDGESEISRQSSLAFHVNTTTGEVALAAPSGWASSENVNDWIDIGLNAIPAP